MYTYVQTYIYVPSEPGWIAKRCPSYDVQADFPPFIDWFGVDKGKVMGHCIDYIVECISPHCT